MAEMIRQKEFFYNYLSNKGLKSTSQREIIVDTFLRTKGHLPIEELLKRVRKRNINISYATVYRTLKLLIECGVAKERHFSNSPAVYERIVDEHHDHMICLECGKIIEFENEEIEALQEQVAKLHHFTIFRHKHEIYGRCNRCTEKLQNRHTK